MAHAILRGANGRRHEVDFGDAELTIEVYAGQATIEIVIEAPLPLWGKLLREGVRTRQGLFRNVFRAQPSEAQQPQRRAGMYGRELHGSGPPNFTYANRAPRRPATPPADAQLLRRRV